jgi:cell division initiation protein
MIDLTPLDVRNKRGDFRRLLRGYDSEEVDGFLELVAERLEELVKEILTLRERTERLKEQVDSSQGREKAVQEALVSAQELRDEIRSQAQKESEELRAQAQEAADDVRSQAHREANLQRKEAEAQARQIVGDAERQLVERGQALQDLERKRVRFLKAFRSLLERELDMVEVEEGRTPLDDATVDLELRGSRTEAEGGKGRGVVLEFTRAGSGGRREPAGDEGAEPEGDGTGDGGPVGDADAAEGDMEDGWEASEAEPLESALEVDDSPAVEEVEAIEAADDLGAVEADEAVGDDGDDASPPGPDLWLSLMKKPRSQGDQGEGEWS